MTVQTQTAQDLDALFWEIIDKSKSSAEHSARKQYDALLGLLLKYDAETIDKLAEIHYKYEQGYCLNPEFELLHAQNGGFVDTGDDGFYMDFNSWLVAQGRELYDAFQSEGAEAVKRYVRQNDIGPWDYCFENMLYAYRRAEEILEDPYADSKWRKPDQDIPPEHAWAIEKYADKTYAELDELLVKSVRSDHHAAKVLVAVIIAATIVALATEFIGYVNGVDGNVIVQFLAAISVAPALIYWAETVRTQRKRVLGIYHVMQRRCPF